MEGSNLSLVRPVHAVHVRFSFYRTRDNLSRENKRQQNKAKAKLTGSAALLKSAAACFDPVRGSVDVSVGVLAGVGTSNTASTMSANLRRPWSADRSLRAEVPSPMVTVTESGPSGHEFRAQTA